MEDGFRLGNLYGSYYADETHSCIGLEIGFMDVPNYDDSVTAHTFSIAFKISHFIFAIGYILKEFWNELNFLRLKTLIHLKMSFKDDIF